MPNSIAGYPSHPSHLANHFVLLIIFRYRFETLTWRKHCESIGVRSCEISSSFAAGESHLRVKIFSKKGSLRTFAPIATAHRYCARKLSCLVMHRARALRNIGKMAIATALRGFNDLGHSVNPTFLSRNKFYLQRSTHCPRMNKNLEWEVTKISRFLSTGHRFLPYCGCKVRETMVAKFELVLLNSLNRTT